jgi:hypothetical protein
MVAGFTRAQVIVAGQYVFRNGQQGRQVSCRCAVDEKEQKPRQSVEILRLIEHLEHLLQVCVRTQPRRIASAPA